MAKAARATISDVAKAAKTGKTSISRYLNGEKHLLSDDLLSRIEKAIAELDYRPSLMARGLKHGRTRLIGLIIADITNPYSVNVMSGIEAACREKGFTLLVCNTNNELIRSCTTSTCCAATRWKASWSTRSACGRMA
jgi:LacI family kdg operon repressor